jgi:hypothetical protein
VLERALEQLGADVVSHAFKRGVLIKAYIPLGEAHALFVATHLSEVSPVRGAVSTKNSAHRPGGITHPAVSVWAQPSGRQAKNIAKPLTLMLRCETAIRFTSRNSVQCSNREIVGKNGGR